MTKGPAVEARCFTRRGALRKASRLNDQKERQRGRSSGWSRFNFGIRKRSGLRPWQVISR